MKILTIVIAALSIVKLWLFSVMQITAFGSGDYDELFFIQCSESLLNGEWLGEYSAFRLSKGPIYPLWLALNHISGLPLLFSQHLLYIFAGTAMFFFLKQISHQDHICLFLIFSAAYLYNPVVELRVLREAVYPALTVLMIAGLSGVYLYKTAHIARFFLAVFFLGTVLTLFWLVREEGIWIIPSMGIMMAYTLFMIHKTLGFSKMFWLRSGMVLILPPMLLFLTIHLVSRLNLIHYNTYTVVETNSRPFVSAFGAINRVNHPAWEHYRPLPGEVRKKLVKVSPSFKAIEPLLPSNISGYDGLLWALRRAVSKVGYAISGDVSAQFYSQLAHEINSACDQGTLVCSSKRHTLMPPLRWEYVPYVQDALVRGGKYMLHFIEYPPWQFGPRYGDSPYSLGSEEALARFEKITHDRVAEPAVTRSEFSGEVCQSVTLQDPENMKAYRSKFGIRALGLIKNYDLVVPLQTIQMGEKDFFDGIKWSVMQNIEKIYQKVMPILIGAAMLGYLALLVKNIFLQRLSFFFVLNTAVLAGIVFRLFILSVIDATSFPAMYPWYLSPLYPLTIIFVFLNFIDLRDSLTSLKKCTNHPKSNLVL